MQKNDYEVKIRNGKKYVSRVVEIKEEKKDQIETKFGGYPVDPNGKVSHRRIYKEHHKKIPYGWIVHHIDMDKKNNAIENLIALPSHCHDQIHGQMRARNKLLTREQTEQFLESYLANMTVKKRLMHIKKTKEIERRLRKNKKLKKKRLARTQMSTVR